jgi:hypothetical protein
LGGVRNPLILFFWMCPGGSVLPERYRALRRIQRTADLPASVRERIERNVIGPHRGSGIARNPCLH